jgi:hypothetical protein
MYLETESEQAEFIINEWIRLAASAWYGYRTEGRVVLWFEIEECLPGDYGMSLIPLDDQGAREDMFTPEIIAQLESYDPERDIVVVFVKDLVPINLHWRRATGTMLTPPEALSSSSR